MEKDLKIAELYDLEHMHDSKDNRHYAYEGRLLKNSTSSFIWKNNNMNSYLEGLEKVMTFIVNRVDLTRNFINFTVSRYYNDYNG